MNVVILQLFIHVPLLAHSPTIPQEKNLSTTTLSIITISYHQQLALFVVSLPLTDQARQKFLDAQKEKAVKRTSSPPVTKPIRSHPSWYKANSSSSSHEQSKQDWPDAKDMKNNAMDGGDVIDGMGNSLDAPSATSISGGPLSSSEPMTTNTIAPAKPPKSADITKGDGLAKGQTGGSAKKASSKETSSGSGNGLSNSTNRGGSSQASPSRLSEPKTIRQKVSTSGAPVVIAAGKEDKGAKEAKGSMGSSTPSKPSTAGGTQRTGGGGAKSEAKTTTATSTGASRGSKETPTIAASKTSTVSATAGAKQNGGKGKQPEKKEENKKQTPPVVVSAVVEAVPSARIETKDDGGRIESKGEKDAPGGDDGDEYGDDGFEPSSRPGSAESKAQTSSSSVTATPVVMPSTVTSQPPIEPDNSKEVATVEANVTPTSIDDNTKDDALPAVTAVEQEPPVSSSSTQEEVSVIASDPVPTATAENEVAPPSVVIEEASPSDVIVPTSSASATNNAVAVSGKDDEYADESFEANSRPGSASGSPEKTTEAMKETTTATTTDEVTVTAAVPSTEATIVDKQAKDEDDIMYLSDSDDNLGGGFLSEKEPSVEQPAGNKETGLEEKKDDKPKTNDEEYDLDF